MKIKCVNYTMDSEDSVSRGRAHLYKGKMDTDKIVILSDIYSNWYGINYNKKVYYRFVHLENETIIIASEEEKDLFVEGWDEKISC